MFIGGITHCHHSPLEVAQHHHHPLSTYMVAPLPIINPKPVPNNHIYKVISKPNSLYFEF